MKRVRYIYEPTVVVSFTKDEVDELMRRAEFHYDARCRAAAEKGGAIYGMNNVATYFTEKEENPRMRFTSRELDLLAKICERAPSDRETPKLYANLVALLTATNVEYLRLNEGG